MTFQYSTTLRNATLNVLDSTIGSSGVLKIFSGAEPANCAAADPSGLLATIALPASPWAAAASGAVTMSGTWSTAASAGGTAASFRIYDGSSNCHIQGSVGIGSGDLSLNSTNIASGQTVVVTSFTVTALNS